MQTRIDKSLRDTPEGREADRILRSCVHCGFCNATCPTYQLLGDERDGPRGRIYLIKEMLEHNRATRETQVHLDRCLTCRSCETTCPSGVQYHRLLDIGRAMVEQQVERPLGQKLQRAALLKTVPDPGRLKPLLKLGRLARPLMPDTLKNKLPEVSGQPAAWPEKRHDRSVILLQGCVQSVTHPQINAAAATVLDRLGIKAIGGDGCCGALSQHLSEEEQTLKTARRNVDNWWPLVESGAEAVLLTASGCAPTVMDYGRLLEGDPDYAERARQVSSLAMDISDFLEQQNLDSLNTSPPPGAIAYHSPCSLQHGLKRPGRVEALLQGLGFTLTPVADAHICCGSAGSYSILQQELSQRLLKEKLRHLENGEPTLIATANIGCLQHIQGGTPLRVVHWSELLA